MRNCAALITHAENEVKSVLNIPRICLLTETFHPVVGGGETHARLLARSLSSIGMNTFTLTRRSDRRFPVSDSIDGLDIYRTPPSGMKRFGKYLMVPFVLRELFRRRDDYDVIFVCGFRILGVPAVMAAKMLNKICVLRSEGIGEMSGSYASAYKRLTPGIGGIFRAWISARNSLFRRADAFVSISKPIEEEFLNQGAESRQILLAPNGIDTTIYSPVDTTIRKALRDRLNLPKDAFIAAYSGKLNQGKGLEHLLKAWSTLAPAREDLHLLLIGSGGGQSLSCEDQLRTFVKEHELESRVTFTGYVETVQEYLQASDLFVFPSENEALGISLIEAMSCGLPAIASDTGGIPEVVQHLINGILIEPGSSDAIVGAVRDLLDQPALARELANHARKTACERYSIESVAARYFEYFTSLYAEH